MSSAPEAVRLPSPPRRERRWFPVLVISAAMVAVVSGGHLAADALGRARGAAVTVSPSVQITPLPGWELAERFVDPPGVRLTKGGASLDVLTLPSAGSDAELLAEYIQQVLEPDAEQLQVSGQLEHVTLGSGLVGSRIAYVGLFGDVQAPVEGEVTAVVSPSGSGVLFDGWSPAGQLQFALDEIDATIASAEIA
jgi:hypothetical protein